MKPFCEKIYIIEEQFAFSDVEMNSKEIKKCS